MSELPYFVAQTATVFAPAGAGADQTFMLDFSLQAMLQMSGPTVFGGLGAIVVLEGLNPDAKYAIGTHAVAPSTSGEQAVNGISVVKLEEGGTLLKAGAVTPQAQQGAVVRGRRGTTGRNAGAAGFGRNPSPGGGGGGIV